MENKKSHDRSIQFFTKKRGEGPYHVGLHLSKNLVIVSKNRGMASFYIDLMSELFDQCLLLLLLFRCLSECLPQFFGRLIFSIQTI